MKYLTRSIWILSFISLFTDMASEMLYPVMPLYLKSIGFSVVLIGVLEGIAEATAGLSKGYFGKLSDVRGKRVLFVQMGYGFSAVSKPLMALFSFPLWIFFTRTLDRLGKGVRTGARDAILAGECTKETRASVFGFHRSMDTLGAVIGPALALLYLYFFPGDYKVLFLIAFIPGLLALIASFLLKENKSAVSPGNAGEKKRPVHFFSFFSYWGQSSAAYRKLIVGLLLFTLFNSSDFFLLLWLKNKGVQDVMLIGMYIFYNMVATLLSFPFGMLADKIGMKGVLIFGFIMFALVYAGISFMQCNWQYFVLFFLYGAYAAATDGVSKAWISNVVKREDTATAVGLFSALQSIATMIASSLAGFLWYVFSPRATFLSTAMVAGVVVIYFILMSGKRSKGMD